ncbi:MAG: rod-binding protein [Pseudomonadota bacterium]
MTEALSLSVLQQGVLSTTSPKKAGAGTDGMSERDALAWEKAKEFEAVFLAQMLDHAGLGATPSAYGGGQGEDAYASFLTREYARIVAEESSVGIAEQVFQAMVEGEDLK